MKKVQDLCFGIFETRGVYYVAFFSKKDINAGRRYLTETMYVYDKDGVQYKTYDDYVDDLPVWRDEPMVDDPEQLFINSQKYWDVLSELEYKYSVSEDSESLIIVDEEILEGVTEEIKSQGIEEIDVSGWTIF